MNNNRNEFSENKTFFFFVQTFPPPPKMTNDVCEFNMFSFYFNIPNKFTIFSKYFSKFLTESFGFCIPKTNTKNSFRFQNLFWSIEIFLILSNAPQMKLIMIEWMTIFFSVFCPLCLNMLRKHVGHLQYFEVNSNCVELREIYIDLIVVFKLRFNKKPTHTWTLFH